MIDLELFPLFRRFLMMAVTIYCGITFVLRLWNNILTARQLPRANLFWKYLTVQLLRIRTKDLWPQVWQIVLLLILLGLIFWAHGMVAKI